LAKTLIGRTKRLRIYLKWMMDPKEQSLAWWNWYTQQT
jgi:hypothetical protein